MTDETNRKVPYKDQRDFFEIGNRQDSMTPKLKGPQLCGIVLDAMTLKPVAYAVVRIRKYNERGYLLPGRKDISLPILSSTKPMNREYLDTITDKRFRTFS